MSDEAAARIDPQENTTNSLSGKAILRALLLALCILMLSWGGIAMTRQTSRMAAVWLSNGIVVGLLMRRAWPERRLFLGAAYAGNLGAGLLAGDTLATAIALSLFNLIESTLAIRLMARAFRPGDSFEAGVIPRFLPICLAAPAVSAAAAAMFLWATQSVPPVSIFASWYASNTLGLLIVVPFILSIDGSLRPEPRRMGGFEPFLIPLLAVALTTFVFSQGTRPLLFLIAPIVLLASFGLSLFAAMLTLAAVAVTATAFTALGSGPIAHAEVGIMERSYLLQIFIAIMGLLVLPVMAVIGQRDRLGQAFRDREELFGRIAEASEAGILYLDTAANVTFANVRWSELAGPAPSTLREEGWLHWIDPRDEAAANKLWATARTLHEATSGDVRYIHPTDGPGWVELSFYPETVDDEVRGYVARLTDVSRRRQAERALQRSEELYRLLAENSHDVILRFDLSGRTLYASSAARRVLGYAPQEVVGKRLDRFVHPDDLAGFATQFPASNGDSGVATVQYRLRRKSGNYVWVEASARLVVDAVTGEPNELVTSIRDIDDRRRSEAIAADAAGKLREGNRLLTLAGSLAQIGHWRFDVVNDSFDCSPQVSKIAGLDRDSVIEPRHILARVHPSDRATVLRTLARARRRNETIECNARFCLDRENLRFVRMVTHAERDSNGALTGVFGVIRDVTDEHLAQRELIRARDAAEAAARAKSDFLATMSHEIRTPMTGVLGMIDLLRSNPDGDERERYLVTLKQSADLLMSVLDDVLDFSRIESGKIEFEQRDFDIEELIKSTLDLFDGAASQKGLLLSLEHRDGNLPAHGTIVRGDAIRLQQVISNLLSNAIKFTANGRITVVLGAQPAQDPSGHNAFQRWRIEVSDTGIGISPEQMNLLFEPFVQAEPGTSRRFGGTGLGLAISRRLIDTMGGRMGVVSKPGDGSNFWLELDLPVGHLLAGEMAAPVPVSRQPLDVLVAEDNPVNQMLIGALLRRQGHRATCVENGRLAVELAAIRHFDCILMDMQMPEMDGLAATRAIRASGEFGATVPIIALTADASQERRRFYNNVGLTAFLTKPINPETLTSVLDAIEPGGAQSVSSAELIDLNRYHELRTVLGSSQVDALLDLLVCELGNRPARIRQLVAEGDMAGARAEAHALRGAASNVGAVALGVIAAAIEDVEDDGALSEKLETLDRQATRTVAAIASLR